MLQKYFDYLPQALLIFQHLEEGLRQYLFRCEVMTAARLHGITKYRININELKKLALGSLVDRFEKLNGNAKLIKQIRKVIKERNFIAHQSYLAAYGRTGEPLKDDKIKLLYDRTVKAKKQAEDCFSKILYEVQEIEKKFIEIQKKTNQSLESDAG